MKRLILSENASLNDELNSKINEKLPADSTVDNNKVHLRTFAVENVSWLEQIFEMLAHSVLQSIRFEQDTTPTYAIHIADTLVFHYQRPAAIYFMEDGVLRSSNDTADLVVSALLARFSSSADRANDVDDILAIYVYIDRQNSARDTQEVVVEYLNYRQLDHLLRHRGKENDGILQRFVPSCGTFQTSVRVHWTTRGCDTEVYSSVHRRDEIKVRDFALQPGREIAIQPIGSCA